MPRTIDNGMTGSTIESLIVNLVLLSIFAIQHSVMARRNSSNGGCNSCRNRSSAAPTFCLPASRLFCCSGNGAPCGRGLAGRQSGSRQCGGCTFVCRLADRAGQHLMINHFELFGLHQVFNNLSGKSMPTMHFKTPMLYNFVRHPIYLGFIIAFWAAPTMTVGHLLFAAVTTIYIFVGIFLEEHDLVEMFGDDYRRYKRSVSMLIPWRKSA